MSECQQPETEDRSSAPDDNVISQNQQQQQQQQLQEQLKKIRDREISVTRQLETTKKTVEDLREQLENRLDTINCLSYELETAKRKEAEWQEQIKNDNIDTEIRPGQSDALELLELKAPVHDMLYAFLSYSLSSDQQSRLLDSLMAKSIITANECGEIQKLTVLEEKVLMLLSRLRRISRVEIEHWLTTLRTVGQTQLAEAKLRTFCKLYTLTMYTSRRLYTGLLFFFELFRLHTWPIRSFCVKFTKQFCSCFQ